MALDWAATMKNPHRNSSSLSPHGGCSARSGGAMGGTSVLLGVAALIGLLSAPAAWAQTTYIRSQPQRITVADSGSSVNVLTNYVSIGSATEALTLLGLPSAYATYGFSVASGSASFGTLLTVSSANVPDGIYPLDVNASGTVTSDLYLTLQSGRMWTGATNVSTIWSSPASWIGGVPPGAANDVLFAQVGAQTNAIINGVLSPNSVVDQNFTIASLRFSQTNSGANYHTININPNVTLALTGTNGLSMSQDYTALGSGMNAIFAGSSGTLLVSNADANITMLEDDQTSHTLDLSRLGTFVATVNRVAPGDYTLYPNLTNEIGEGYSAGTAPFIIPNKFTPKFYLARTNFITALYADPYNYSNALARSYALEMVNNPLSASSSSAAPTLYLGVTNVFNLDSVCFSGFGGTTLAVSFNPSLFVNTNIVGATTNYTTNTMTAIFRNTNGVSRMSTFCVGDLAGSITNGQGNTKGNVNFGSYNGYLDMLVDRFYMSRDRTNLVNGSGDDAQTTFSVGAGIIDANTVVIGDQENGNQPFQNFVYGTMTVSNKAVLKVNRSLQLGYETASNSDTSLPGVSYGILSVGPGGTVIASAIGVGGITKNSGKVGNMGASSGSAQLNTITLTNGATLIVSNTIADSSAFGQSSSTAGVTPGMLGALNMYNSELVLNVDGNNPGAYVFTSTLNNAGSTSNYLVIASIKNLTVPSVGSTNIPLLWIQNAAPNAAVFTKVVVPSGYQGALVADATNNQILDLNLSAHAPRNLKWEGYLSGDWDTTTQNWLDLNTGLHTNFDNGDFTTFDDSASVTSVNITSTVLLIPNNVTVTNNQNYYTFGGSGSLAGGSTITKAGTNTLEIDAQITLGVQINQGTVVGTGATGSVGISAGATWNYSGTVNGNIACAGLGLNNGTIAGPVTVSGGVFTNFNTLDGIFNTGLGGFLYNSGTISYTSGTSTVGTNSVFVNGGTLNVDVISVGGGGTFEDLGALSNDALTSVSVGAGGIFLPGGPGIGTTTLNSDSVGSYPGAALLTQGSITVFNVDVTHQTNTVLECGHFSFGASATAQTENGATLLLDNISASPFSAGQYFTLFVNAEDAGSYLFSTGSSTNTYPVISPASPGPGLTWDLSQLWLNGSIGVIPANQGPPLTSSFAIDGTGTNMVGQFSWSQSFNGGTVQYRLETQVNPLSVGLSTNWSGIPGSNTNTSMTITNVLNSTNCVFYRLTFP